MNSAAVSTGRAKACKHGRDEHGPDRHRHAEHGHARCAHLDDRGHVVDRAHHRRDADEDQAQQPERLAVHDCPAPPTPTGRQAVDRPSSPPPRPRLATKKLRDHADEGRPHEPVAEHVQRRERHVVGADHQRDQEVAEGPGQNRDDHEEDHHRGVHREQHGVELGRDLAAFGREQHLAHDRHVRPGPGQLPADGQRQQPADDKPQQRREQELDADHLVIEREHVSAQKARPNGRDREHDAAS